MSQEIASTSTSNVGALANSNANGNDQQVMEDSTATFPGSLSELLARLDKVNILFNS